MKEILNPAQLPGTVSARANDSGTDCVSVQSGIYPRWSLKPYFPAGSYGGGVGETVRP